MIFVTGDTHANLDIGKLSTRRFPEQKELTKEDFLIVCGDFGLVWDGSAREIYWQDWLSDKNFTTLWIDGNHESFDILYELPLTEKFDGKVREIAPDIYHLDRGQVLTIDDQKIFVMGGARLRKWNAQLRRWTNADGKSIMLLHIVLQKAYRKWCVVGMKTTLL